MFMECHCEAINGHKGKLLFILAVYGKILQTNLMYSVIPVFHYTALKIGAISHTNSVPCRSLVGLGREHNSQRDVSYFLLELAEGHNSWCCKSLVSIHREQQISADSI